MWSGKGGTAFDRISERGELYNKSMNMDPGGQHGVNLQQNTSQHLLTSLLPNRLTAGNHRPSTVCDQFPGNKHANFWHWVGRGALERTFVCLNRCILGGHTFEVHVLSENETSPDRNVFFISPINHIQIISLNRFTPKVYFNVPKPRIWLFMSLLKGL